MKYLILSFIFCLSLSAEDTFFAYGTASKSVLSCDEAPDELIIKAESLAYMFAMRNCRKGSVERLSPFEYSQMCAWGQPFSLQLTAKAKFSCT